MELLLGSFIKSVIFPPGGIFLVFAVGLLLLKKRARLAKVLLWGGVICGCALSTPLLSSALTSTLNIYPSLTLAQAKESSAQAIVVLSANRYKTAPEYGGDTLGDMSLVRARYGAFLYHHTHLPVVAVGGYLHDEEGESLAAVIGKCLENDFGVPEVWLEERSRTTAENALYAKEILHQKNIDTIMLVTHSYHMPRAVAIFERMGLKVIPAPTMLPSERGSQAWLLDLFPSAAALRDSYLAMHEWLGRLWYAVRY